MKFKIVKRFFNKKALVGTGIGVALIVGAVGLGSGNSKQPVDTSTVEPPQEFVSDISVDRDINQGEQGESLLPLVDQKFYDVIKVIDGDTLSIDLDGKNTTLRLIGINTPETVDPRRAVECFGREASDKAKELLSGKRARIEADSTQGTYDKYNRLLVYVYLEDGLFFNKYMIEEGYAYEYTYSAPYKYQSEFKEAERRAKEAEKGFWAPGACDIIKREVPALTEEQLAEIKDIDTSQYTCFTNRYNCGDFATHAEAQAVYYKCGGVNNDIHRLDRDADGFACEGLP